MDTLEFVDLFAWWWSSKIHIVGIILMRKKKIAGENLEGEKNVMTLTVLQSWNGKFKSNVCDKLTTFGHTVPFIIIPLPPPQSHYHLSHQRQVENGEKPVISIVLHPHHSPYSYERDEDKERPGHHGTDELEEHDGVWKTQRRRPGSPSCCRG